MVQLVSVILSLVCLPALPPDPRMLRIRTVQAVKRATRASTPTTRLSSLILMCLHLRCFCLWPRHATQRHATGPDALTRPRPVRKLRLLRAQHQRCVSCNARGIGGRRHFPLAAVRLRPTTGTVVRMRMAMVRTLAARTNRQSECQHPLPVGARAPSYEWRWSPRLSPARASSRSLQCSSWQRHQLS